MLIGRDKGHVELSASLTGTWAGSAGAALVDLGEDLGHARSCPLSYLPICLHAAPWHRTSVCFLKTIKSF